MTTTTEVRVLISGDVVWSRFNEDGNSGGLSPGRQATEEQEQVVQLLSEALDQAKGQLDLMKRSSGEDQSDGAASGVWRDIAAAVTDGQVNPGVGDGPEYVMQKRGVAAALVLCAALKGTENATCNLPEMLNRCASVAEGFAAVKALRAFVGDYLASAFAGEGSGDGRDGAVS